jgi:hypothetical protein
LTIRRLSPSQGHSAARRIRSIEKSSDIIGNQTHDLPAKILARQPKTILYYCPLPNNLKEHTVLETGSVSVLR